MLLLCVTPLTLCPVFVSLCCSAMCVWVCACICGCTVTLCAVSVQGEIAIKRRLCVCLLSVSVYVCMCCCCHCPCCGTHCGCSSYRSCFPALLAKKSSHDAALKKLSGSPFTAGCADTLGWSVFVLAPLLVVALTLKHLTFPAELRQRIMPDRLKQPETDSNEVQYITCNRVN